MLIQFVTYVICRRTLTHDYYLRWLVKSHVVMGLSLQKHEAATDWNISGPCTFTHMCPIMVYYACVGVIVYTYCHVYWYIPVSLQIKLIKSLCLTCVNNVVEWLSSIVICHDRFNEYYSLSHMKAKN